ncbi:GNAT family N-acetyltransferase [Buttiauxella gaviniae]|uniref:GNAT family N-acetyltransferase n=1 Tax=Buttiauxella gaviniae TaxID=82990 RepID=UPI003BB6FBB0
MKQNGYTFHITTQCDANDIRDVETLAFGFAKEADLVAGLLSDKTAQPTLSLLARHQGKAIGHILFTRVTFKNEVNSPLMHILAPLAVVPQYQRMGVGGLLMRYGIEQLEAMGSRIVFVLGHAEYYPRYGFEPCAGDKGFHAPYPIPDKYKACWMMQSLSAEPLSQTGEIMCAQALMRPEHWRE